MFFNMRTYRVLSVSILIHVLYIFKNIMSNYSLCVLLIRDLRGFGSSGGGGSDSSDDNETRKLI